MMDKQATYNQLEAGFLTYQELVSVPVRENGERLVDVADYGLPYRLYETDVAPSTGEHIYVRQGVAERLLRARDLLSSYNAGYDLQLFYGYRNPDVQRATFDKIRQEMGLTDDSSIEALEKIHRYIAVPAVAGHPTGGAVDILISDSSGQPIDMGTAPHEFSPDSYVLSPFIDPRAQLNRKILRDVMLGAGFAPFDGEWWHFSYGDREWAAYYKSEGAIYENILLKNDGRD